MTLSLSLCFLFFSCPHVSDSHCWRPRPVWKAEKVLHSGRCSLLALADLWELWHSWSCGLSLLLGLAVLAHCATNPECARAVAVLHLCFAFAFDGLQSWMICKCTGMQCVSKMSDGISLTMILFVFSLFLTFFFYILFNILKLFSCLSNFCNLYFLSFPLSGFHPVPVSSPPWSSHSILLSCSLILCLGMSDPYS